MADLSKCLLLSALSLTAPLHKEAIKIGRNQRLFAAWPCICFALERWMWPSSCWAASEIPAAGYNASTLAHSLARSRPYETKSFAVGSVSCGFQSESQRERERMRQGEREGEKGIQKPVGIRARLQSKAKGTAATSMQQCEWKITAQHWPRLCCFPRLLRDTL